MEIGLDRADGTREIRTRPGDTVIVRLDETPTSGYRWVVEEPDPGVLRSVGDEFAAPSGDTLGGGGTRIFRFEVVGQGTCNLEVTLRRSWEPVSAEAERFRATIEAE